MKRWQQDLRYGISALLLVGTVSATATGIFADLLDLNDFVPHTLSGYAMAALAIAHTILEWPRLLAYGRHRLQQRPRSATAEQSATRGQEPSPSQAPAQTRSDPVTERRLSRRGLLALVAGGAGGFLLGRATAPPTAEDLPGRDLGLAYHLWSKPSAAGLADDLTEWGARPEATKRYPDAARVALPAAQEIDGPSAYAAIEGRRSVRAYSADTISLTDLSTLLHLTTGITAPGMGAGLRAAPSAGALYPIETYVIAHSVTDLVPGLYHYAVTDHELALLREEELRQATTRLGLMQGFLGEAGVVIVLTMILQRLRWRYRRRSYRYALLEAGHIGQNVYLAAEALGMGACAVGAFLDDPLNELLGVDGEDEAALYMIAVGSR